MVAEDPSSSRLSLLQLVTDIFCLVMEGQGSNGHILAVTLTIAQLGQTIEWVPLSPCLWHGPELDDQVPTQQEQEHQSDDDDGTWSYHCLHGPIMTMS